MDNGNYRRRWRLVDTVRIGTRRDVYEDGDRYYVETWCKGPALSWRVEPVSRQAVDFVLDLIDPRDAVTVSGVCGVLSRDEAARNGFSFVESREGFSDEVERAFIVLVALGKATATRAGKGFRYSLNDV